MHGTDDQYFATIKEPEELASALTEKVEEHDRFVRDSGLLELWQRSSDYYYQSLCKPKSVIGKTGENNEYSTVFVNHFRNILQHVYITTVGTRPTFDPRATSTDFRARAEIRLARSWLDYYFDDLDYESHINYGIEGALVCGEWFTSQIWDRFAGEIVDVEKVPVRDEDGKPQVDEHGLVKYEDRPIYAGDPRICTHSPADIIRDPAVERFDDQDWIIVRGYCNRWKLAALYPEKREQILQASRKFDEDTQTMNRLGPLSARGHLHSKSTDEVCYYTFYHKDTPQLPGGRIVTFVGNDDILYSEPLVRRGYRRLPVYRNTAGDIHGLPYGYSFAFDLLALQDLLNLLYSTATTNASNFGVAAMQAMKGSGIVASQLVKGLLLIEYNSPAGKVEPLEMGRTPQEIYQFIERVEAVLETLSGVNSVARGNPEASLKSGAALALVQSQHIQFTQGLQSSHARTTGALGTDLVVLLQKNANSPRTIAIVGRANRSLLREVQGKDIANIRRVVVDTGNYLSKTPAGRVELAQQLLQGGMVESPEQFIAVLSTGRLEPVTHGKTATLDLIAAENEMLLEGEVPSVIVTDNHPLHIIEHGAVTSDPEARRDPAIVQAVTAHLQEHINQLKLLPPELAALLKLPILPPVQPGLAPNGATNAPGVPGTPGGMPNDAAQPVEGDAGAELANPQPALDSTGTVAYPINPATGAQWTPGTGGL